MKRWSAFAAVLALLGGALVLSQARKVEAPVGPNALLYFVADTQRELTRLPMKYTEIPDAEEIKIGNRIAEQFDDKNQDDESKLVEAYLRNVGGRVAAHAARKLPYKFHYLPERGFINAFAIPGGHVFVGAGLINLMENEDELAAVLGHEIEHIDHRHCAERLQVEAALRKVPLGELIYIPVAVFQAGYNKDQELEADREGTALAVAAGYSPNGAIEVFTDFQRLEERLAGKARKATPEEEISSTAVQILTGYFRSHPPSADRIAEIQKLIRDKNWTLGKEKPLDVRYIFLGHQAEELAAAAHYDKAIQAASTALELHPGHAPALLALAKATCAQHDFQRASAAYKQLLASHQADADAVRAFAEQLANNAMAARHFEEAGQFVTFSLQLQPDNAGSLKLLAEVKLELGDVRAALEAGRKLERLYPQTAASLNQYAFSAGEQAFQSRDYPRAARFASFSLDLVSAPQLDARSLVARSDFALAAFRASADAYRKMIEIKIHDETTPEPELISAFADSLGSVPGHAQAAREFQTALRRSGSDNEDITARRKIEEAGLLILAGNASLAQSLTDGSSQFAPEHAARLGWWYYRAGKYDAADQVLRRFLAQRPGDAGLQTTLGWVALEKNNPAESLRLFNIAQGDSSVPASAHAGQAVARWRLQQSDAAMIAFDGLSKDAPEWINPNWVRAIYGPVAGQSAQEMYAEQQRRIAAHKR